MKPFLTLLFIVYWLTANAQSDVAETGQPRLLKANGKRYKVEYFGRRKQYRYCEGNDFTLKPLLPGQKLLDNCNCDGRLPPLLVSFKEIDKEYLEQYASFKIDETKKKWTLQFADNQSLSGDDYKQYAFLKNITDGHDHNNTTGIDMQPTNTCSIDHLETSDIKIYSKTHSSNAMKIVNKICAANGNLRPNFKVLSAPVKSASAVFDNKKRFILYSEDYLAGTGKKTKWATYFVLAHEIAHHLNGDMLESKKPDEYKVNELAADRWAGFAMHMLGAPRKKTLAWVNANFTEDPAYPTKAQRVKAINDGWRSLSDIAITQKYWLSAGLTYGKDMHYTYREVETEHIITFYNTTKTYVYDKDSLISYTTGSVPGYDTSYTKDTYRDFVSGNYFTLDMLAHLPVGKVLPHFAVGVSYSPLREYDALSFTLKTYVVDYFKNNFNGSVSFTKGIDRFQLLKMGLNYTTFAKRMDCELFAGTTSFSQDFHMICGLSLNYCFLNSNRNPK